MQSKPFYFFEVLKTEKTTGRFLVKDFFTTSNNKVKISKTSKNFKKKFVQGKIEKPIQEQEISYENISGELSDKIVINKLGGEDKAETTFQEVADLLTKHANGEECGLLINGFTNKFYIKDTSNIISPLRIELRSGFWHMYETSVETSSLCGSVARVFYRKS
jgi:hypothetical protein